MISDYPVQNHWGNEDIRQAADISGPKNAETRPRGFTTNMRVDDDGYGDGGADPRTKILIVGEISDFTEVAPYRFVRGSGDAPAERTCADARVVAKQVISIIKAGRPEDPRLPISVSSLKIVTAATLACESRPSAEQDSDGTDPAGKTCELDHASSLRHCFEADQRRPTEQAVTNEPRSLKRPYRDQIDRCSAPAVIADRCGFI